MCFPEFLSLLEKFVDFASYELSPLKIVPASRTVRYAPLILVRHLGPARFTVRCTAILGRALAMPSIHLSDLDSGSRVSRTDHVIGEVSVAVSVFVERPSKEIPILEGEQRRAQNLIERRHDSAPVESIGAEENPYQFAEDNIIDVQMYGFLH